MKIKRITFLTIGFLFFISLALWPQNDQDNILEPKDVYIGKSLKLKSKILDTTADLQIYLPRDYERSKAHYPVIYTFRYFHVASGILSVHTPRMILVDFSNFNYSLFSLYEKENEAESGKAYEVLQFLKQELIPFIDSNFRTKPTRVLYGGSSGGLFAIYALFTEPSLFDVVFAAGPMFAEFDEDRIFNIYKTALKIRGSHDNHLFFTAGDQPELLPHLETFQNMLKTYQPKGLKWKYDPAYGETHMSIVSKTLHEGLQWYFSQYRIIPDHIVKGGKEVFTNYMDSLLKKFGGDGRASAQILSQTISHFRMEKDYKNALAAARLYVEIETKNPIPHYLLAETYVDMGEIELARDCYKTAIKTAQKTKPGFVDFLETKLKKLRDK